MVNLYRPPYCTKAPHTVNTFLEEFETFVSNICQKRGLLLIVGDFNIYFLDVESCNTKETIELLQRYNMQQLVTRPTHKKGGLIDLLLFETSTDLRIQVNVCSDFSTYHYPVKASINIQKCLIKPGIETVRVRNPEQCNLKNMMNDIKESKLVDGHYFSNLSPTEAVDLFNTLLSRIYNTHCHSVTKRYRTDCKRPSWYNHTLQTLKQNKRKAERKYNKNKTEQNRLNLQIEKKIYNDQLKQCRSNFNSNKINKFSKEPKKLFKILGRLSGTLKENITPTFGTKEEIAEKMSDYFINKVCDIRKTIENENQEKYKINQGQNKVLFNNFLQYLLRN